MKRYAALTPASYHVMILERDGVQGDPVVQRKVCPTGDGRNGTERLPVGHLRISQRKLFMIDHAVELRDLAIPPNNRLEALRNDRAGQHSIRINDKWRVCFRWTAAGPEDVEIVDYH